MHAQDQCTKGPIRLSVHQEPTVKGGANRLAPVWMSGRRAFNPFMILLFVHKHILVMLMCFFWESCGRQNRFQGICIGSWIPLRNSILSWSLQRGQANNHKMRFCFPSPTMPSINLVRTLTGQCVP